MGHCDNLFNRFFPTTVDYLLEAMVAASKHCLTSLTCLLCRQRAGGRGGDGVHGVGHSRPGGLRQVMTKTVYMLYSDSMHGGIYAATGFTVTPGTCPTVCL